MRLALMNGLKLDVFVKEVLTANDLTSTYSFIEDVKVPDVIVVGPYGANIPRPGPYLRVAYICENYRLDQGHCEYTFGVSRNAGNIENYQCIQWHGFNPNELVKAPEVDAESILAEKTKFCNFLYSNPIGYREDIFKRISKYKRVDSPGRSMNNMPSIDDQARPGLSRWDIKRKFLRRYKFTLALENDIFSGYQTEKLYDAMRASSVPVYVGDPQVTDLFDEQSFVCIWNSGETPYWISRLEEFSQMRWSECQGSWRFTLDNKIKRKLRILARDTRHKWLMSKWADALVDAVVALDKDEEAYIHMMQRPWLRENKVPECSYSRDAWCEIFDQAIRDRAKRDNGVL